MRYQLPPGCDSLPFDDSGAVRAGWVALDQCGKADAAALTRTDSACAAVGFRVPAAATFKGYPAAYPMGVGEGIYLHTSRYAPAGRCGPVRYRFEAPGSIVTGMQSHAGMAVLEGPQAGDMPAMAAACAARHMVQFELKDGSALALSCPRLYRAPDVFYGVDIDKVLARLGSGGGKD